MYEATMRNDNPASELFHKYRREIPDSPKQNLETALSFSNDCCAVFDQMEEWQNNWKALCFV